MNKELLQFCRTEFEGFRSHLQSSWAVSEETAKHLDANLRNMHKRYLGFSCVCAVLSDGAERSSYLRAAPEACHLSLVLTVKGLENPAYVLMRQCIELVFKHIYFATHPVEYSWLANRVAYREINFQYILDYIRKTEALSILVMGDQLLVLLEEDFHILSRYVHVHNDAFIGYGRGVSIPSAELASFTKRAADIMSRLCLLLAVFFPEKYTSAQANEQALIGSVFIGNLKEEFKLVMKNSGINPSVKGTVCKS